MADNQQQNRQYGMHAGLAIAGFSTIAATYTVFWWFLRSVVQLPFAAVVLLLGPAALISLFAAIYGWGLAYYRRPQIPAATLTSSGTHILRLAVVVCVFVATSMIPWKCGYTTRAAGAAVVTVAIAFWLLHSIQMAMKRNAQRSIAAHPASNEAWKYFKRRFRILTFSLVAALPIVFTVSFVILRIQDDAIALAIVAALVLPWSALKIREELRLPICLRTATDPPETCLGWKASIRFSAGKIATKLELNLRPLGYELVSRSQFARFP